MEPFFGLRLFATFYVVNFEILSTLVPTQYTYSSVIPYSHKHMCDPKIKVKTIVHCSAKAKLLSKKMKTTFRINCILVHEYYTYIPYVFSAAAVVPS